MTTIQRESKVVTVSLGIEVIFVQYYVIYTDSNLSLVN